MKSCKFCNKFNNIPFTMNSNFDTILFESRNFVVTPTMGSLVENWLLISSKNHFICAGELDNSFLSELEKLTMMVKAKLANPKKNIFVFEHGPCYPLQTTGCGIDHMHIHIVPLDFDLFKSSKESFPFEWQLANSNSRSSFFKAQVSYLYIESPANKKYIVGNNEIPSQFFRRVIANKLNLPEQFDWKLNFGNKNIEKTISFFSRELELT